jgi:3D (Asp-Asp-Asp) domain-containing protein
MRRILGTAVAAVALAAPAVADADGTAATSYCLHGRMADGSYTRPGSAAMNGVRLGTRIRLTGRSFYGQRTFVIRDRIGWGTRLDLWHSSCAASRAWGRRWVSFVFVS